MCLFGNSLLYGIGKIVWWIISSHMLKNQHRYAEISADRSIPIPLQPPHLLHFDILPFPDQKQNWRTYIQCLFCFIQILYQLWDNLFGIMWCNGSLSNSPCWHTPSQWWTHTIHGRIAIGYPHFCGPKSPFAGSWILNVPIKYSPYLNLSQEIAFFVLCVFFHLFSLSPAKYGCFRMFRLVFAIRNDHQHHRGWLWVNSHL